MTPVSQFAQYLLKQDPQRSPARLTTFNYFKHVADPTLPFTPELLQNYFGRVLQFDHWQNDAQTLSETLRADLQGYIRQYVLETELDPWNQLRLPDTLQMVPIKLFHDLEELVRTEYAPRQKSGDEIRTIKLEHQILVLVLQPSGSLEVKVYPNMALVWGARLRLPAPVTHLHYGADFELMPHVRQTLEGSLLTTHSFHVDGDGVHGLVTRGYTFQKFETFIRAKLSETQDLFGSLKKLERHFINPQTDPHYQEMVTRLERANRLLQHGTPETLADAERALIRGRQFLKNVFPHDRLLTLLVTHLDYGISQKHAERFHVETPGTPGRRDQTQ